MVFIRLKKKKQQQRIQIITVLVYLHRDETLFRWPCGAIVFTEDSKRINVLLRTAEIEDDNTDGVVPAYGVRFEWFVCIARGRLRADVLSYLHYYYTVYRYTATALPQKSIFPIPVRFLSSRARAEWLFKQQHCSIPPGNLVIQ